MQTEAYDSGIFRMIDAASRPATAMVALSSGESRAFLEAFLAEVNVKKMWSTRDREPYGSFLRETSRRTAEHLVTRVGEAGHRQSRQVPRAIGMPTERGPESAETVLETIRSRRVTRCFDERPVTNESLL